MNLHTDHPGYSFSKCKLSLKINAKSSRTMNGFACSFTGGHCVPGEYCNKRRQMVKEKEKFLVEFN